MIPTLSPLINSASRDPNDKLYFQAICLKHNVATLSLKLGLAP